MSTDSGQGQGPRTGSRTSRGHVYGQRTRTRLADSCQDIPRTCLRTGDTGSGHGQNSGHVTDKSAVGEHGLRTDQRTSHGQARGRRMWTADADRPPDTSWTGPRTADTDCGHGQAGGHVTDWPADRKAVADTCGQVTDTHGHPRTVTDTWRTLGRRPRTVRRLIRAGTL